MVHLPGSFILIGLLKYFYHIFIKKNWRTKRTLRLHKYVRLRTLSEITVQKLHQDNRRLIMRKKNKLISITLRIGIKEYKNIKIIETVSVYTKNVIN